MPNPIAQPLPDLVPPIWLTEFQPFSKHHLIVVSFAFGLVLCSCLCGLLWSRSGTAVGVRGERSLRLGWAGLVVSVNIWSLGYWFSPAHFDVRVSLPLQLCDLCAMLAPIALSLPTHWRSSRVARTMLYFWGIGLSSQAFVSPTLVAGLASQRYWIFWLLHLSIVGSGVYDVVVRRFRPSFGNLILAIVLTYAWAVVLFLVNQRISGANYGYIANTRPVNPTLLDKLGPWPERIYLMLGIVTLIFTFLWAIWQVPRLFGRPSSGASPEPKVAAARPGRADGQ